MIPVYGDVARPARLLAAATAAALLAGCSSLPSVSNLWPFGSKPAPVAPAVDAIVFETADGTAAPAFPQYWKRNTLVIDLSAAPAAGSVTMKPRDPAGWPVRLAIRVLPGAVGQVEVRAAQRVLLPVSPAAAAPLDLELAPSVYARATPQIVVSWGQSPPGA